MRDAVAAATELKDGPPDTAAAMHYSVERRLGEGSLIAVYDLGGGTFDATVLRARPHGMEILGHQEGIERMVMALTDNRLAPPMGGIEFDDSVLAFVDDRLDGRLTGLGTTTPDGAFAHAAVREACRQAKEQLSSEEETVIRVPLPGTPEVVLNRIEFAKLIRPLLELTIDAVKRTITGAGRHPDELAGILLAGGSSRIPLVAEIVSETLGRPVRIGLHPKLTVALGAATIAWGDPARPDQANDHTTPQLPGPSTTAPLLQARTHLAHAVHPAPTGVPEPRFPPVVRGPRRGLGNRWLVMTAVALLLLLVVIGAVTAVAAIAEPRAPHSTTWPRPIVSGGSDEAGAHGVSHRVRTIANT